VLAHEQVRPTSRAGVSTGRCYTRA
jgi:hypothetical protein